MQACLFWNQSSHFYGLVLVVLLWPSPAGPRSGSRDMFFLTVTLVNMIHLHILPVVGGW